MTLKLKWHGHKPEIPYLDEQVIEDLKHMLDLEDGEDYPASGLAFHTVFLSDDLDHGPVVSVWGEENDDEYYHCEYVEEAKWMTLEEYTRTAKSEI